MNARRGNRCLQLASETSAPERHPSHNQSSYSLQRGYGCWELIFAGRRAVLKEHVGLIYAAWLLGRPHQEPVHGAVLATAARERPMQEPPEPVLTELSLGKDDYDQCRKWRARQRRLQALLDDPEAPVPVKAEVERELADVEILLTQGCRRSTDAAQKMSRAARKALGRFVADLEQSWDATGRPHQTLRQFGQHLRRYLLVPSNRYAASANGAARTGLAGRFSYEPPEGVVWRF